MRSPLALVLVLGSLAPASVRAQATPVRVGATRSMTPTDVAIAREEVDLECSPPDDDRSAMPCDLRVRITLSNAGTEAAMVPLLFTLEHVEGATIGEPGIVSTTEAPTLRPLTFPVPSGSERTLEISARVEVARADSGSIGATDALAARHPLLATSTTGAERHFVYARPVAAHFTSVPDQVTFHVRVPEGFYLHTEGSWDVSGTGGDRTAVVHGPAEGSHVDVGLGIRTGSEVTEVVRNGGPFLAFGAAIGDGRPTTFRGRAGYEIGFLDFLALSVAVETDFTRSVELAVMLEVASPSFVFPPSLSIGVGVPVRVWGDAGLPAIASPTAGLRLAGGATFLAIGFEALFDYWPQDSSWVLGLLGRVGI